MHADQRHITTFGERETVAEFAELRELPERRARLVALGDARRVLNDLDRRLLADRELYLRSGRWRHGQPDPSTFVPGDVVALRYMATEASVRELLLGTRLGPDGYLPTRLASDPVAWHLIHDAHWSLTATPFFLPVSDALGVMGSHPPTAADLAELRLPFPAVSVYFAADLGFDPRLLRWSALIDSQELADATRRKAERLRVLLPPFEALDAASIQRMRQIGFTRAMYQQVAASLGEPLPRSWNDPLWGIRHLGGYLTGVTLFAGAGGLGLADDVLWTVACNPDPDAPPPLRNDRIRALVLGQLSRSTLRPLAENLAAVVAWGPCRPPDALSTRPICPDHGLSGARPRVEGRSNARRKAGRWPASASWTLQACGPQPRRPEPTAAAARSVRVLPRTCVVAIFGGSASAHGRTGPTNVSGSLQPLSIRAGRPPGRSRYTVCPYPSNARTTARRASSAHHWSSPRRCAAPWWTGHRAHGRSIPTGAVSTNDVPSSASLADLVGSFSSQCEGFLPWTTRSFAETRPGPSWPSDPSSVRQLNTFGHDPKFPGMLASNAGTRDSPLPATTVRRSRRGGRAGSIVAGFGRRDDRGAPLRRDRTDPGRP